MLAVCFKPTTDLSLCKDACFCLASIAAQPEGNRWLAGNPQFLFGDKNEDDEATTEDDFQKVEVQLTDRSTNSTTVSIPIGALTSLLHIIELGQPESAWFAIV